MTPVYPQQRTVSHLPDASRRLSGSGLAPASWAAKKAAICSSLCFMCATYAASAWGPDTGESSSSGTAALGAMDPECVEPAIPRPCQ